MPKENEKVKQMGVTEIQEVKPNLNAYKVELEIFDGTSEHWEYFKQRFEILVDENLAETVRRKYLLSKLGPEPFRLLIDYFRPTEITKIALKEIMTVLDKYYIRFPSILAERVAFTQRARVDGESVHEYFHTLRRLAGRCNFGINLDERLRDQGILGINNREWQKELLKLPHTAKFCDVEKTALLSEKADIDLNSIANSAQSKAGLYKVEYTSPREVTARPVSKKIGKELIRGVHCLRCARNIHATNEICPADKQICKACGKPNHFARACVNSGNAVVRQRRLGQNKLGLTEDETKYSDSEESCTSGSEIYARRVSGKTLGAKIMLQVHINNTEVQMLYDPGASRTVISKAMWYGIGRPRLTSAPELIAYTGIPVVTKGEATVQVQAFGKTKYLKVIVVDSNDESLFGMDWLLAFRIPLPPGAKICKVRSPTPNANTTVPRLTTEFTSRYPNVFSPRLGTMKGHKATIWLKENDPTKVCKARPVLEKAAGEQALHKQKEHHDNHCRSRSFPEGEEVWELNESRKRYKKGTIIKRTSELSYRVEVEGIPKRKHADQLTSARGQSRKGRVKNS